MYYECYSTKCMLYFGVKWYYRNMGIQIRQCGKPYDHQDKRAKIDHVLLIRDNNALLIILGGFFLVLYTICKI